MGLRHPLVAPLAALALGIVAAQFASFSFRETLLSTLLLGLLAWVGLYRTPSAQEPSPAWRRS